MKRFAVFLLFSVAGFSRGQLEKKDYMIPMRDGIKLHTEVWAERGASGPLPFMIDRSPYGWKGAKDLLEKSFNDMVADGYLWVFQDIRGRYQSEGKFVMLRPVRDKSDPKSIDEASDTYDTIAWLLKNVPNNNGRAGIMGISYGGWLTTMAIADPHPALRAASEQASPADMYLGDDFHHNGAFRLSYGLEYSSMMETGRENNAFKFDRYDTFDWYLRLGSLSEVNKKYFDGQRPTWNDFVAHPNYDEFWQKQAVAQYVGHSPVPNLNVAGWFDQEDFYGPFKIYEAAEKYDTNHLNYLVVGPWNHGGWARSDGHTLGKIDFGADTAKYFRAKVQAVWFSYWLKDKGKLGLPEALAFQTGSNEWKSYDSWPPKTNIENRELYLQSKGGLGFDKPAVDAPDTCDSYVSDPAKPVPYRNRPIPPTYGGPGWTTWLADDQRFVDNRPDVLSWQTAPLSDDLTVTGDVVARFFASTTGTDSDWIVKLIDVYPEVSATKDPAMGGYELMIAGEVLRGRFRDSYEQPKPVTPGEVVEYKLDLLTHNHKFMKGHRVMVQIQSTWFPLIDRNPQKFVPNIFNAAPSDYQSTTQRVCRSGQFPSHVLLPVVTQ